MMVLDVTSKTIKGNLACRAAVTSTSESTDATGAPPPVFAAFTGSPNVSTVDTAERDVTVEVVTVKLPNDCNCVATDWSCGAPALLLVEVLEVAPTSMVRVMVISTLLLPAPLVSCRIVRRRPSSVAVQLPTIPTHAAACASFSRAAVLLLPAPTPYIALVPPNVSAVCSVTMTLTVLTGMTPPKSPLRPACSWTVLRIANPNEEAGMRHA